MPNNLSPESAEKPASAKTADDINDLFNEIDKEEVPEAEAKPEKKAKQVDDQDEIHTEEDDKEDDLELVDDEDEIEKLDLAKPDDDIGDIEAPPRKKEIQKEFPDIFKKFPFLEKMMYRDKEYTALFGSFDDAKELAEKAETFNAFESQLLAGDTQEVLKNIKDADETAFNKIVDDYLPTLAKVDKEAYFHVVGNLNKRLIKEMVQEAQNTGNDDLKQAALLVNQFVFGTSTYTEPTKRVQTSEVEDKAKKEIEQERLSFVRERFESSRDEMQTRVDNTIRATISQYVDPKDGMTPLEKRTAINRAMELVEKSITSDEGVKRSLDRLWRSAFDDKFSKNALGKIQSYYLSKAKGSLKNAILKARSEVLKESRPNSRKQVEEEIEEETPATRRTVAPGRPSQPKNKNGMKQGESVAEFFARD